MHLPKHIVERIEHWVAATSKDGFGTHETSARYGGLSLMGTLGATWFLRPDGTFWNVDDDLGTPLQPLGAEHHVTALVWGLELHPWLAELLPSRPRDAQDCDACSGRGRFDTSVEPHPSFILCPNCSGLGW